MIERLRQLAPQSALIFAARLAGAGLVFVTQALIARIWGAATLGDYLLTIASVNLIAFAMPLGFNVIAGYFAAAYAARGERDLLTALFRGAYRNIALAAIGLFVVGPLAAGLFRETFGVVHHVWLPAMVLATAMAVVFVNGAFLVGMKHPQAGFAADVIFRPLVMIAGVIAVMTFQQGPDHLVTLIWIAAIGYAAVAAVHAAFTLNIIQRTPASAEPAAPEPQRWWAYALPWILISIASDFYFDIDLLLLSNLMQRDDLAIFGVCARVFSLIAFGIGAIYAVAMPSIVEAGTRKDPSKFLRRITDTNLAAAVLALAASLAMLLIGSFLLSFFGPAFSVGAAPLAVMCLGLAVRSAMGPTSLVLTIHDRPYASLPAIALGLATLVIGNWTLVPSHGLMGAALSALISMTVWSIALWLTALRCTNTDVSIFPLVRRLARQ